MEACEKKREGYLDLTKEIPTKNIVYIDKSVSALNLCKDMGWVKKGKKLPGKRSSKYLPKYQYYSRLC